MTDVPGTVVHIFNPSIPEEEVSGFLSLKLAWSTQWIPGQPELHDKNMSQQTDIAV